MRKVIVLFTLILGILGCARQALVSPSESDEARAMAKFPGTTLADLTEGKSLYENNCGKCHGLKSPVSRSEEKWRQIVPRMAKKAKVDAQTEDKILKYLIIMSENQSSQ